MSSVLSVDGVTKTFGGLVAVDSLSLTVEPGEALGILGPNGAGKTALINMVSGFYRPTAGTIRLFDREITDLSLHQIGRLGIARTFQNIRLFRRMTVLENVMTANPRYTRKPLRAFFGFGGRRHDIDEAMALVEFMGLADRADRIAGSLPYGDARRLEMARALATGPRLLLLDEPGAGMNEEETERLIADIHKCRERLAAIVLIEHDMTMIRKIADRVVAMNYGRKMAEGRPTEVLSHPEVKRAYLGTTEGELV
ncbi:MAG: ABC transporter ATP-binding protein [Alphaproteobacteria bacterium]|nr:ABC transporter ATP-binding protein [Alphaproteobacteria bacterium]